MIKRLLKSDTIMQLKTLKGNPRYCIFTEPLWGIPFHLYIPFLTLFMFRLGLDDADIGLLVSIGLFLQMIMALLGGVLTDKFGRRLTTICADIVSWTIPTLLWAFAQDFRWFLAAAIFNSVWHISGVSWQCLLVEDYEEEKIVQLYNWMYIAGLIAVLFAPLAAYFIGVFSLVPVMRVLLVFASVSMTLKFIILYKYCTETTIGIERQRETKDKSIFSMLLGYKDVIKQALTTPATVRVLMLITFLNIQIIVSSNFFSLYVTEDLGLPEQFLAWFPILRSAIMLIFFIGLQEKLNRYNMHIVMLVGLGVFIACTVLLLAVTPYTLIFLALVIALDACAAALFLPRRDTMVIHNTDPKERARIMSILVVFMLGVSSPFGIIIGRLSLINRRIPFMINIGLFILMSIIVIFERISRKRAENEK